MNISPIMLLAIGASFAFLYGLIITIGWAITRKNRKVYHESIGYSEVELFDLKDFKPLGEKIKTISLENNHFFTEKDTPIDLGNFDPYIVETTYHKYPELDKGDLILVEPQDNKIKYAFKIPDLKRYR